MTGSILQFKAIKLLTVFACLSGVVLAPMVSCLANNLSGQSGGGAGSGGGGGGAGGGGGGGTSITTITPNIGSVTTGTPAIASGQNTAGSGLGASNALGLTVASNDYQYMKNGPVTATGLTHCMSNQDAVLNVSADSVLGTNAIAADNVFGKTAVVVRRGDLVGLINSNETATRLQAKQHRDHSITISQSIKTAIQPGADIVVVDIASGDLVRQQNTCGAFIERYDLTAADVTALLAADAIKTM